VPAKQSKKKWTTARGKQSGLLELQADGKVEFFLIEGGVSAWEAGAVGARILEVICLFEVQGKVCPRNSFSKGNTGQL